LAIKAAGIGILISVYIWWISVIVTLAAIAVFFPIYTEFAQVKWTFCWIEQ
jgi:hypothetical protein